MTMLRLFSMWWPSRSRKPKAKPTNQGVSQPPTQSKRASVRTRNPSFRKREHVAEVGDESSIFVFGNGDGVALVSEIFPKKPYSLKLTDDPDACTHAVLVASKGIFQHTPTMQVLDQTMTANKKFMVLFETSQAHGGAPVKHFLDKVPNEYSKLKDVEWVPIYRSEEQMLNASILTVLGPTGWTLQQQLERAFVFFLSHKQQPVQAKAMMLATKLECIGFKVWLDVQAKDLCTGGMMDGVNNSENFLLIFTDGYFESKYCRMELDKAVELEKPIVVIFEEREEFGGASLDKLKAQVPDKYAFLTDTHVDGSMKHGWIRLHVRDEFEKQMIDLVLKHCDIPPPNQEVFFKFSKVPDSTALVRQNQAWFLPGTREWMFKAVEQWLAHCEQASNVFGVLGQAGVGKSVFSAQLALADKHVVARHFFKHDDRDLSDLRQCIWSLAKQLRDNVPGFRRPFDEGTKEAEKVSGLDVGELFTLLISDPAQKTPVPVHGGRMLVIVDALDECSDSHTMASLLKDSWRNDVPKWLGVLFTTRPSVVAFPQNEAEARAQGVTVLNTENASNKADVRRFLSDRVFTANRVADPSLAAKFVEDVTKKSEGLFLYLRFLDEVIGSILVQGQRTQLEEQDLEAFPNGLGGVYNDYFGRLHAKLGPEDYVKLLGSILSAREPLSKELWMRAFGVKGGHLDDEAQNENLSDFFELQQQCENLLHVPRDIDHPLSNGVRFVHKSMVDYLTGGRKAKEETALKNNLKQLHIKPSKRNKALAKPCLEAFQSNKCSNAAKEYAGRHAFFHLCEAKSFDQAEALLFNARNLLQRLQYDSPNRMTSDATAGLVKNENVADEDVKQSAKIVANVLRLGSAALSREARELAGQVVGRLSRSDVAKLPRALELWDQAWNFGDENGMPWLRPVKPCLTTAMPSPWLRVINGHTGSVDSVALSPDGKTIASGSWDNTIRLWDAETGEARLDGKRLNGHVGGVSSVAFSPNSGTIASGSWDNTIRLWDATTGDAKLGGKPLLGHTDSVTSVAFSPNSGTIASASWDNTIRLWDATTGEAKHREGSFKGHTGPVTGVAFSPDGSTIASASSDNTIRLWEAETGEAKLGGRALRAIGVTSVAFSPNSKILVSGSDDNTLRAWDGKTGAPKWGDRPSKGHTDGVYSVAFSPDGHTIVSASDDKTIRVWDASTGEAKNGGRPLRWHTSGVRSVVFLRDNQTIVSGATDKTIRWWDATADEAKLGGDRRQGHTEAGAFLAFSPDGRTIAIRFSDSSILLWDTKTCEVKNDSSPLKGHTSVVCPVAFSPDNSTIVTVSDDTTIRLWDAQTGQAKLGGKSLEGHTDSVKVGFSPDGRTIVNQSENGTTHMWDAQTGEAKLGGRPLEEHAHDVTCVSFSPDGRTITIASGSIDETIRLWDAETGEAKLGGRPLEGHIGRVESVAFSPDGRTIASGSIDETIRLWDAETGDAKLGGKSLEGHTSMVCSVAFSPDGRTIASGSEDNTIRLWDAETGDAKLGGKSLEGHTNTVCSVAFSPDSRTIASGSGDNTIRLWDAETGEAKLEGRPLKGHTCTVFSVAFSPDGRTIASGSGDNTIRLWDAQTGQAKLGGRPLEGHTSMVCSVAFSTDSRTIASGSHDKTIRLWDAPTGKAKLGGRSLEGHTKPVCSVSFSPDSRTIASVSSDNTVRLWDAQACEAKLGGRPSKGQKNAVTSVSFSPDSDTIVSASCDMNRSIRLWDAETGEAELEGRSLEGHTSTVFSVAFSTDSRTIASGSHDKTIRLWDAPTGKAKLGGRPLEGHTSAVCSVAFSPDSRTIASGSNDNTVRLWDAQTGQAKLGGRPLKGHTSAVCSVAFSGDGSTIVSGSKDKAIRLWDAETGDAKLGGKSLEGHTDSVELGFSPDGRTIVNLSENGTTHMWDAESGEAKALAGSVQEFNCLLSMQGLRLVPALDSAAPWIPFSLDEPCEEIQSWTSPSGESLSWFAQGRRMSVVELIRATPGTDGQVNGCSSNP
jgi:WD40 repeat protein